jgi:CubicO group peptidase (beta-lactamase class C family)
VTAALSPMAGWPVDAVAGAVIGSNGIVETFGDVRREFALASVTKPLAALAALVAVEEGALALDDPVAKTVSAVVPGATVRHLLAHASGLAADRLVQAVAPGTRRIYSNVGIDALADQIATAAGMSFVDYFREAVGEPLRLEATTTGALASRDGISTVADLAQVAFELLAPTGLLHPTTLAAATSVQFPGLRGVLPGYGPQAANDWGLGFEIKAAKTPHWTGATNSARTYGHFGQAGTMLWVDPDARLGLVALTDRPFGDWARAAWPTLSDTVLAAYRTSSE